MYFGKVFDLFVDKTDYQERMQRCIQDPIFHAEGDVWTHTLMVMNALQNDPEFQNLSEEDKDIMKIAVLFHDVAKPWTRDEEWDFLLERMKVSHHGHSRAGAKVSFGDLYRLDVPQKIRKEIYMICLWHQRVFHLFGSLRMNELIAEFSLDGNWKKLLMFARADNKGRISPNTKETHETLELLKIAVEELNCYDRAYDFDSWLHIHSVCQEKKHLEYVPYSENEVRPIVIMTSGLPGAGKDYYCENINRKMMNGSIPIVSLDNLRKKHKDEGKVIQEGFEACRVYLREKTGFIFNATNTNKLLRDKWLNLFHDYAADVSVREIEVPYMKLLQQNRSREKIVPESVIETMIMKWEPVLHSEAWNVYGGE